VAANWKVLYETQALGVWALLVLPALFLGALAVRGFARGRGVEPYAARFVRWWAVVFAIEILLDPIATGPFAVPMLPFVLLGDFRVFALVLVVMQPGRARPAALLEAAAWTLVVPLVALGTHRALIATMGPLPDQTLWLAHEIPFTLLAIGMAAWLVPARVGAERGAVRRYVRAVLGFVAGYYALWALADVLILSGRDGGWGLRVVPNLLYYGVFVPAAYQRFFASRYAASSTSTHTAR